MEHEKWILAAVILLQMFLTGTAESPSDADRILKLPGQPHVSFQQYAGYVTVDEKPQRSLFYYFVEAETDPASKPLVLWLNGGPGCSSVGVGAFIEHGPFKPKKDKLIKNYYSWNKVANMLYLESPAGVGYSYSANKSFYTSVNDEMTAGDNLEFLKLWFTKFPEYKNRDFFITGESYAGHYVPQLAALIIKSEMKLNLKAIAIGNPLLEFDTDSNSGGLFLWSHGVISDSSHEMLNSLCNFSQMMRQLARGNLTPICKVVYKQVSREISDFIDPYGVTLDVCLSSVAAQSHKLIKQLYVGKIDVCVEDETTAYLNRKDVQEALHASLFGVTRWNVCSSVVKYEWQNREVPTLPMLGDLIKSGIRILVYSGDQDSVIPLIGTRSLINGLAEQLELKTTVPYLVWFGGKQVGGWTQIYGDNILSYATVRGGSHEVPFSQPERSLVLFSSFLKGEPMPGQTHT